MGFFDHINSHVDLPQGLYKLVKYLDLKGFPEKFLKIKSSMKTAGESLKTLKSTWILLFS